MNLPYGVFQGKMELKVKQAGWRLTFANDYKFVNWFGKPRENILQIFLCHLDEIATPLLIMCLRCTYKSEILLSVLPKKVFLCLFREDLFLFKLSFIIVHTYQLERRLDMVKVVSISAQWFVGRSDSNLWIVVGFASSFSARFPSVGCCLSEVFFRMVKAPIK